MTPERKRAVEAWERDMQQEADAFASHIETQTRPKSNGLTAFVLFVIAVFAYVAMFTHDGAERARCERSGGRVADVHGWMSGGRILIGAWTCERGATDDR